MEEVKNYLIAYTRYKSYFSLDLETISTYISAYNMAEAIKYLKEQGGVYQIIAISALDDSIKLEEFD